MQVFTVGQPVVFQFKSLPLTLITIKDIEVTDINAIKSGKESKPIKAPVRDKNVVAYLVQLGFLKRVGHIQS